MSRRHSPRGGRPSTDPLAVNRATNSTRARVPACPEVVAYHRELRDAGHRISLAGVRRFWVIYQQTFTDAEGFLSYCLTYLDPTGEQATHNVMATQAATSS